MQGGFTELWELLRAMRKLFLHANKTLYAFLPTDSHQQREVFSLQQPVVYVSFEFIPVHYLGLCKSKPCRIPASSPSAKWQDVCCVRAEWSVFALPAGCMLSCGLNQRDSAEAEALLQRRDCASRRWVSAERRGGSGTSETLRNQETFNDFSYNGLFLSMHSLNITRPFPAPTHTHIHAYTKLYWRLQKSCVLRQALLHTLPSSLIRSRSFIHLSLIVSYHFLKAGVWKCEQKVSSLHLVSKSARISDSWCVTYLQNAAFDTTYTKEKKKKTSSNQAACQEPSLRDTRPALIDLLCVPRAISQPDTEGPRLTEPAKLSRVSCGRSSEHSAFRLRPSGVGVTRTRLL